MNINLPVNSIKAVFFYSCKYSDSSTKNLRCINSYFTAMEYVSIFYFDEIYNCFHSLDQCRWLEIEK